MGDKNKGKDKKGKNDKNRDKPKSEQTARITNKKRQEPSSIPVDQRRIWKKYGLISLILV